MGAPRRVTLRHRLEYAGFRLVESLLRLLPDRAADAFGGALGWLAGSVLRIRRDVVEENLARAFPEMSAPERIALTRATYRHLGREAVATFRSARESAARIRERTVMHGAEPLLEAARSGGGAVVLTGHAGNWEIAGSSLAARGVPLDGVAFRQRNPLFDRALLRNRERLGIRIIPRGRAHREVLRTLREGRVAGFVADQNAGRRGLFVDFFGVPASTARGPAVFALRAGVPLFVGVALRDPSSSRRRYLVHVEEVPIERTGDVETDVRRLTAAHTAALERWVREAPEQYFWVHKRWKTRPPGEA